MTIYKAHRLITLVMTSALLLLPMAETLAAQTSHLDQNSTSTSSTSSEIVEPGKIYNDSQPTRWVGKSVTLQDVAVQDTNDSGNFWVGSDDHHRLLVVKPATSQNLHAVRLHKGDLVTITGVVRPASDYMSAKTGAEKGSMDDAKDSAGVFLMADKLTIISSTQH
jgi:hypothetical protein